MCRVGEEEGLKNLERPILRKYKCRLRRARDVFGRYYPLVAMCCIRVAIIIKTCRYRSLIPFACNILTSAAAERSRENKNEG